MTTFVKSGHHASYTDFWRLVELSGFDIVRPEEVNLTATGTYIFPTLDQDMMACLERAPKGRRRARAVFWNLERPDANLRPGMDMAETYREAITQILEWADEIWVFDRLIRGMDERTKFAVLGGHPELVPPAQEAVRHDLIHIGQLTPRRIKILDTLRSKYGVLNASWGPDRAAALASSRALIGIDRVDGLHISAPLRWAVAAATRLPILQEEAPDPYPLVKDVSILMAPYGSLAKAAGTILDLWAPEDLAGIGKAAYDVCCREWTFRRGVEEALAIS